MTSVTSKSPNPSDRRWPFRLLVALLAFFAGYLASRASAPTTQSQISPKKPVNISSSQLIFDKLRGLTLFKGKVKALHGTVVLTADEIRAFSENNAATAKGHVKVVDKTQGVTLTCGNLEYQDLMETMTAHDHPVLTSVDSAGKPVTISGRQMELDSEHKIVVINQNVKIVQANSNAEAQKATFFANDDKLVLENDPLVYTSSAQISARRITTSMGPDKSFFAEGMADAIFNTDGSPMQVKSKNTPEATPGAKAGASKTPVSTHGIVSTPTPSALPVSTTTPSTGGALLGH